MFTTPTRAATDHDQHEINTLITMHGQGRERKPIFCPGNGASNGQAVPPLRPVQMSGY
ncbi:MAG TPA: hypothetical protein PKN20_00155 [Verrucomicrobiota bacterium]|jgi:hypothetical protein|nr:hypothetical protein [Verrucomicrobiota bacterium]HOH39758.1 hypothetical protein [Verrucomicrobiota bacterium]